jgi:heparin/heparan-sulfate lyase
MNGTLRLFRKFVLFGAFAVSITVGAPAPDYPKVPSGHPRVYVRPGDLPEIRAKIASPAFKASWEQVKAAQADPRHGWFYSAFVYLVTQDKGAGRRAVEGSLSAVKASTDARTFGMPFHLSAVVYDWCYDLLAPAEKQQFIAEFERIAGSHTPGYPARPRGHGVIGHDTEGWVLAGQLPAGVAIYDESRTMYDAAIVLFHNVFVPPRNFHYPGHAHHQGDSYFSRFIYDQAASWLFRRMGAGDVFSREQQFVPYQILYNLRPDGQQLRRGDTFDDSGRGDSRKIEDSKRLSALLAAYYYDDPYLLWAGQSDLFYDLGAFERVFELLFRKPGFRSRPLSGLPQAKYFDEPIGEMVARTGWNLGVESRDAVIAMRIGQYFFGNHQRKDFGTFQIYYRGALAISSGLYRGYETDHWKYYYHETLSHNGLLVFDPDEAGGISDGGQRLPDGRNNPMELETILSRYKMGEVVAHELGPDRRRPEYSYLAGDITQAYTAKVSKVTRSMVALDTRNHTYPATLVVFDRVHSAKPEFKKRWVLHSIQEPQVKDRSVTVVRDENPYGGKLLVESLLPQQTTIAKIGGPGKEFWVENLGKNFPVSKPPPAEPGAWRIEISPAKPALADRFLHVLTVTDAATQPRAPVRLLSSANVAGAGVLDWSVFFSDSGESLSQAEVKVPLAGKVLFCDAVPGTWNVIGPGNSTPMRLTASAEGKCLYFKSQPGTYRLAHVAESRAAGARR